MSGVRPGPWGDETPPVFGAPWHARAFALVVALHERGVFSWGEWGATLAAEIRNGPAAAGVAGIEDHAAEDHAGEGHEADREPAHRALADHDEPAAAGDEYYRHWLAALEHLVEARQVASRGELARLDAAWAAAAARTPHGMAIELRAEDFDPSTRAWNGPAHGRLGSLDQEA